MYSCILVIVGPKGHSFSSSNVLKTPGLIAIDVCYDEEGAKYVCSHLAREAREACFGNKQPCVT